MIDVCEDDDQGNDNADEQIEPQDDKVKILTQTLSMLKEIHSNGEKLCDNAVFSLACFCKAQCLALFFSALPFFSAPCLAFLRAPDCAIP